MKSRMKSWNDLNDGEKESILDYLDSVAEDVEFSQDTFAIGSIIGGTTKSNRSLKNSQSFLDTPTTKIRYRYNVAAGKGSRVQSNTREFCSTLINNYTNKGKVFRKEDINNMSIAGVNTGFGPGGVNQYDIFLYKGGNNCRHEWESVTFSLQNGKWVESTMVVQTPTKTQESKSTIDILGGTTIGALAIGAQFGKETFADQQIVAGPLMIPDKLIYRFDEQGEYYVYFPQEAIKKIAYKYMEKKYTDSANIEHDENQALKDVFVVESWIVSDPSRDKSAIYSNGEKYPKGTWYGVMKIKNKEVWEEYVKSGKVKGFSVEGYFIDQLLNNQ